MNVFISYRHEDKVIAAALGAALKEIERGRVNCFYDVDIRSGEGWEARLQQALEEADWLVAIHTGVQSEFCGYEVGIFSRAKEDVAPGADARVTCLHSVPEAPGHFRAHQNKFVPPRAGSLPGSEPRGDVSAMTDTEVAFYEQSGVFEFLQDFCGYRDLWVVSTQSRNAVDELAAQRKTLLTATRRIHFAFEAAGGTKIRSDTPTQLSLEIAFPSAGPIEAVPGDALATGTFGSFALFGLMPAMRNKQLPSCTWDELRAACRSRSSSNALWMSSVEREMVNVGSGRALGPPEGTFMAATGQKVYRPILVRHVVRNNGMNEFEIVFVETLPKQFVGYQNTSLLLAGLVQSSRFRFMYLEEPERVAELFDDAQPDDEFAINCRQLQYDLDRLQSESVEFGLLDRQAFIAAFGPGRKAAAESFGVKWDAAKTKLLTDLPDLNEKLTPDGRQRAKAAVNQFLSEMRNENRRFVLLALDAYKEEVARQR